jgi:MYXO-CTERM domain-containing protein
MCKESCASDDDCANGNKCNLSTQRCIASATCDGDHTTTSPNGTQVDCTPYKCENNGTCKIACSSVQDCIAPNVCGESGACVPPPAGTGDSGGCAMGRAPTDPRAAGALFGLVLAILAMRRRTVTS